MAYRELTVYGVRWHNWIRLTHLDNFQRGPAELFMNEVMATAEGYLRRLTRRLTEDPEQRDVEELSDEAANTGAQRAIDCERGQEVTMVGTLRSVEANAKGCAGGVRAELFDGTDTVTLVWLGQRRIPGIDSGRKLRVRGRLGKLDNGTKAIYNPHYEIQR